MVSDILSSFIHLMLCERLICILFGSLELSSGEFGSHERITDEDDLK